MNQMTIFDAVPPRLPRARNTDPSSSHAAADKVERSGLAKRQAEEVLSALKRFPMATSAELAKAAGIGRTMAARRLPELATANLVQRYNPTADTLPCAISGIRSVRWCAR